jgi:hypothetical protein
VVTARRTKNRANVDSIRQPSSEIGLGATGSIGSLHSEASPFGGTSSLASCYWQVRLIFLGDTQSLAGDPFEQAVVAAICGNAAAVGHGLGSDSSVATKTTQGSNG